MSAQSKVTMKANNSSSAEGGDGSSTYSYFIVSYDSCLIVLSFLIISINILVLVLFTRRRPLRSKTNLLLASLSVSDLMMGLLGIPMSTACNALVGYRTFSGMCISAAAVYRFIAVSTIFHILAITAEKYVSVIYPFKHTSMVTKKRIFALIISVWTFSLFVALIQLAWQKFDDFTSRDPTKIRLGLIYNLIGIFVCFLFPLVLMLFFYAKMFNVIRLQTKKIIKLNKIQKFRGNVRGKPAMAAKKRAITIFALMLGIFTCCWSTWYIGLLQDYLSENVFYAISGDWLMVFDFLRFSTSLINPVLYTFLKKDFRAELRVMIPCCKQLKYERQGNLDQVTSISTV